MAIEQPGIVNSKDYDIKQLDLINSGGQVVDLRKVFIELQIFQDLFSSVMSGSILIQDGHDVFNNFYLCGNEYIQLSIDKPSLNKPLQKVFRVYKSAGRKPASDTGQMYQLYFCSEELIFSNQKIVSKSYKKQKTVEIIKDILKNELKVDESKIKSFEQTSGIYDYIVPGYRPLEAIQWAVSRSYDASKKYCYFFYEDRDGFQFKSYNTLVKQKPLKTLKYEIKTVDQDPAVNRDSIDKFEILNDFDILTSISNGAFASKLLSVDIFNQSFKIETYSLDKAESEKNLLNKFKPLNSLKNQDKISATTAHDSFFKSYISINDQPNEKDTDANKWLLYRALHMALMHNQRIKIIIPGDIFLKAGDVVKYEFPKFEGADKSGKSVDEYRTGNYLVAAINHKFVNGDTANFESVLELVSDSVSKAIPGAKDGLDKVTKKFQ